jgi:hypothetical protein
LFDVTKNIILTLGGERRLIKIINIGKLFLFNSSSLDFDVPYFDVSVLTTGSDGFAIQPGEGVDLWQNIIKVLSLNLPG